MVQLRKAKLSSAAKDFYAQSSGDLEKLLWMAALGGESHLLNEISLAKTYPDRKKLLAHLANLRDALAIRQFWTRWERKIRAEYRDEVLELRDGIRAIWREAASPE